MANTGYKTIDQYHGAFSTDVVERMQTIRDIVHKVVPDVVETISYQIPCFKYNGYLIYYSAHAKHISLLHPYSADFLSHFKDYLKDYKVTKSAIQFPNKRDLPVDFIAKIIKFRKQENITRLC